MKDKPQKIKRTFGLAVLLKMARVSLPEVGGAYLVGDLDEVIRRVRSAMDKHGLRLRFKN